LVIQTALIAPGSPRAAPAMIREMPGPKIVSMQLRSVLCAWLMATAQGTCLADDAREALFDKCTYATEELTAALVAKDWEVVERLALRRLPICRPVHSPAEQSENFEEVAWARFHRDNFTGSLAAARDCITLFYGNPGCHLVKAYALHEMSRDVEARGALQVAERLVEHALQNAHEKLERANSQPEQSLHRSKVREFQSILNSAHELRSTLGP
jgi:hypothetical protein